MNLNMSGKIMLVFLFTVASPAQAQNYTNFQINMITELNNACRREGGGPNFCACYASTTTNTLKPADYLSAKVMEKNGIPIERTQAYAMMDAAAYVCSSLADPKK
jgi:hypothetical protein